nr:probable palmitoyltransferase ZDHHC11 [Vicugna pacos]
MAGSQGLWGACGPQPWPCGAHGGDNDLKHHPSTKQPRAPGSTGNESGTKLGQRGDPGTSTPQTGLIPEPNVVVFPQPGQTRPGGSDTRTGHQRAEEEADGGPKHPCPENSSKKVENSQDLEEPMLAQISSTESSKERPPAVVHQMPFCARSLRRVIPEASAIRASQTLPPRLSRVNGWSRPLHFFQAIAWAMFLFLAFTTFGVFIPFLPLNWRYMAYGVTGGLFLFHFLVHVIAVSIDPADTNVRMKKNYAEPVPTFDRSKYLHVIQNRYCHLCEVTVSAKAKHCSSCNKCVEGFDHHCKWLNNCVGTRNYWFFFSSVASAFVGMLCVAGILLYIFIQYVVNPVELRADQHYRSISNEHTWVLFLPLFPTRTKTPVVLTLGASVLLLNAANLLLLGHLLFFHLYLMSKKLSTYDYVIWGRQQRNLAASQTRDKASQVGLLQLICIKMKSIYSSKVTTKKVTI